MKIKVLTPCRITNFPSFDARAVAVGEIADVPQWYAESLVEAGLVEKVIEVEVQPQDDAGLLSAEIDKKIEAVTPAFLPGPDFTKCPGITKATAKELQKAGIFTWEDFLSAIQNTTAINIPGIGIKKLPIFEKWITKHLKEPDEE